jgi:hypothetical protein
MDLVEIICTEFEVNVLIFIAMQTMPRRIDDDFHWRMNQQVQANSLGVAQIIG